MTNPFETKSQDKATWQDSAFGKGTDGPSTRTISWAADEIWIPSCEFP